MKWFARIGDWIAFPYGILLLLKDPGISGNVKIKAGTIVTLLFIYILNPADIIPDFIPVLGWLEDILAIPVAMIVIRKIIPEIDVTETIKKARSDTRRFLMISIICVGIMALISLGSLALLIYFTVRYWC